jgi:hypothetical protein
MRWFRRRPGAFHMGGFAGLVVLLALATGGSAIAAPTVPTPLSPANSASVTLPVTISWSAASDPSGITAYNWQVSATSTFAKIVRQGSVTAPATQDSVSGLAAGTFFWRVQAVSNDFVQGPWSATRSFSVTGAGAGVPATPTLNQPRGGNSFHPWESFGMSWSAVPGAVKYVLEASKDSAFPANGVVFRWESTNPSTDILITTVDRGSYSARVFAVDANGNYSMPSNVIGFTIAFNAPIGAPPTLVSPTGGAASPLPVTFRWNHVVNPQSSSYRLQVARDAGFTQIEQDVPFITDATYTVIQLPTAGTKFWRVNSSQGVIDTAGTAAVTAWSQVGTFVVPDGPLRVNTISLLRAAPTSGQEVFVDLQLSKGAPAGGATVNLSSSNPQTAPVPASVAVPATHSWVEFRFTPGQVSAPTSVTMTATIGAESTTTTFSVDPSSLKSLDGLPASQSGGVTSGGIVMLNGQAPPGGALVSLSSSSAAAQPPATVTVPAGVESASFSMPTSQVSQNTTVTITATWKGVSVKGTTVLTPQPAPTSLTLDPTVTSGSQGSNGRVTAADPRNGDVTFSLSSSRPDLVQVPGSVTVPEFAAAGGFIISTVAVSTQTVVTISVSGGGVTLRADLTLNPMSTTPPPTTLSTLSLSPSTLNAGTGSTGVVTSNQTAPSGGLVVTLSSSDTTVASVPQSVTIPAGGFSASFPVSTSASAATRTATITGSGGGVTQSAVLTSQGPRPSAVSLNPSTVAGGATSTGTITLTQTAPAGGMAVSLSSTDTTVLTVPGTVSVAAGASSASFTVSTTTGSADRAAHVVATANGVSQNAALTVTAGTAPPPPATDTVTISRAQWKSGQLRVDATSSSAGATLKAYVTSSGALLGTISGGRLQTNTASSPGNVTVKSSLGGQASRAVSNG